MLDLLVTNANLPDGRTGMSIAVQNGRIVEIAKRIDATSAQQVVDPLACSSPRISSIHTFTWTPR